MDLFSSRRGLRAVQLAALVWVVIGSGTLLEAQDPSRGPVRVAHDDLEVLTPLALEALFDVPCENGHADAYPCHAVDLLAFLPPQDMGGFGQALNDLWGFTDAETGHEYALVGLGNGTAFVDVTVPTDPVFVGHLPTQLRNSPWRDVKVHAEHAYIISEGEGHGMQVFDLRQLRDAGATPQSFTVTAHYAEAGLETTHNVAIDEESGFAYLVGSNTCDGGLHVVDLREPAHPTFAGCASAGYVHDAQCMVYRGPDAEWRERQVCINSSVDHIAIVDVTDKAHPAEIGRASYSGVTYAHQSWTTEDQLFMLSDDELDELRNGNPTRTFIWSLADLDRPMLIGQYTSTTAAIDHNLYIRDGFAFQANYNAGLRILDLSRIAEGQLTEIAHFDVNPATDEAGFDGSWGIYPFFESGTVLVNSMTRGLFVLRPRLP